MWYLKVKSVLTDLFLLWFLISALFLSGCGPHAWKGVGHDLAEIGDEIARINHQKIQRQEHGLHYEHYEAYRVPLYSRLRKFAVKER